MVRILQPGNAGAVVFSFTDYVYGRSTDSRLTPDGQTRCQHNRTIWPDLRPPERSTQFSRATIRNRLPSLGRDPERLRRARPRPAGLERRRILRPASPGNLRDRYQLDHPDGLRRPRLYASPRPHRNHPKPQNDWCQWAFSLPPTSSMRPLRLRGCFSGFRQLPSPRGLGQVARQQPRRGSEPKPVSSQPSTN